ncbi:MAG TPA: OsmC family protein [Candidatus Limnocylindrales bacterium]|nr:OsmC family protein [Candidatus Limnocylindrales bacterium]
MQAEIINATEQLYRTNPDGARSAPAVRGRLVDGKAELSAGSYTWYADLPPALGGTGSAPTPTQYLLGALAGCGVAFIHDTLAPQLGISIDDLSVVARCRADARGLLGMDGAIPDLEAIEIEISVATSASAERLAALEDVWRTRCPIYLAVVNSNDASVMLTQAEPAGATH